MVKSKMSLTLLCILLIGQHVQAVVNKGSSQAAANTEDEKKNEVQANDRISNSYGPPANDYGPPIGLGLQGPAPVYGPPELVGDHGPTPVYPPPPPDIPPPIYGPPLNIKPHHGPPKQSFGPPLTSLPAKQSFSPPKLHYGPPKQHFGPPPSFTSFRPPKPHYGPPLKFAAAPSLQYIPTASLGHGPPQPGHGPPQSGHGPPIPISLEAYGPPPPKLGIQFNSHPSDDYGPPPLQLSVSQSQHGPPAGDLYGPPPPAPPPGVPAPPTPPDIKYDGWQPIAGLANQHGPSSDVYAPPSNGHQNFDTPPSVHTSHSSLNAVSQNSNVPSDSYGVPIHNPEAQDLKSSVHQSSASSESEGLPPPPLPQYEPLHNEHQNPPKKDEPVQFLSGHHQLNLQYEVPKVEPLSIVKTVGFELLPSSGALTSDLQGLSLSDGGGLSGSPHDHLSNSVNSGPSFPQLQLQTLDSGSHDLSLGGGDTHSFHNVGSDISLQQVSNTYGAPLPGPSFGKINTIESGVALPPPPLFDSYSAPPLSSYSPNGPYAAAHAGRASSSFSSFGFHSSSFHKHGHPHHRPHGSFRSSHPPPGSLIPPRNREPIKFKESIPSGLVTNLHRYLPPIRNGDLSKPPKSFIPPLSFGQQLPNLNAPVAFHKLSGISNSFSNSHNLISPIAAPNAHYGTPLSFGDFNTPAPVLTYGAPNFGPASTFGSTSTGFGNNLYDGFINSISSSYGTPIVNAPLSTGGGHDCGFQQPSGGAQYSLEDPRNHLSNLQSPEPGFPGSLPANHAPSIGIDQNSVFKVSLESVSNSLDGSQITPSVNHLDLQHYEQQKADLKDSYGNPVGISYESSEQVDNALPSDGSHASSDVSKVLSAPSSSQPQNVFSSGAEYQPEGGISAEALTSSLTLQGFGQSKSLGSNVVDASQFLNSHEGSEALSLAQGLTAQGTDGFQVQGSKGTYMLQIQAADGDLGTENSDGSIRHDQVLSNGLLQDILAAIEQPEQGRIQLQGGPEAQQLEKVYGDLSRVGEEPASKGHYITIEDGASKRDVQGFVGQPNDKSDAGSDEVTDSSKNEAVALFFNNQLGDTRKETRSVTKNEKVTTTSAEDQKSVGKTKTS